MSRNTVVSIAEMAESGKRASLETSFRGKMKLLGDFCRFESSIKELDFSVNAFARSGKGLAGGALPHAGSNPALGANQA